MREVVALVEKRGAQASRERVGVAVPLFSDASWRPLPSRRQAATAIAACDASTGTTRICARVMTASRSCPGGTVTRVGDDPRLDEDRGRPHARHPRPLRSRGQSASHSPRPGRLPSTPTYRWRWSSRTTCLVVSHVVVSGPSPDLVLERARGMIASTSLAASGAVASARTRSRRSANARCAATVDNRVYVLAPRLAPARDVRRDE